MRKLSDFKKLWIGTTLMLIDSDSRNHKLLNIPRKIIIKQTNSIKFEGGSWLEYPKASECEFLNSDTIKINWDKERWYYLTYKIIN